MNADIKGEIRVLEFCISYVKQAQKAKDPHEKLAAVKLEIEFARRIERLKEADKNPELPISSEHELAHAGGDR